MKRNGDSPIDGCSPIPIRTKHHVHVGNPLKSAILDNLTNPDLQDSVISIISTVVDDFEMRLRELIRASTDLNDLEGRVPIIRGQCLAQYGIRVNELEQDPPSLANVRTNSSSPGSGGWTTTMPSVVADLGQSHLGADTNYDQITPQSYPQQIANVLPSGNSAQQDIPHDQNLIVSSDLAWFQNHEFADFDSGMLGWNPNDETWSFDHIATNDMTNSLYTTEGSKNVDASDALVQQERLG